VARLGTAIQSVRSAVQQEDRVGWKSWLSAQFAGGTGSGMFLDVALILRHVGAEVGCAARVARFLCLA